jgi:hypothetical protein
MCQRHEAGFIEYMVGAEMEKVYPVRLRKRK